MKIFLRSFIVSFFLLLFIYLGLFYFQLGALTPKSRGVADLLAVRKNLIRNIEGEKIFIVGGSASTYGISAEQLSEDLGKTVINGGLRVDLQLPYLLGKSKEFLESGDTVLLSLEYDHFFYNGGLNETLVNHILSRDLDYLYSLSLREKLNIIFGVNLSRLLQGILYKNTPAPLPGNYTFNTHREISSCGDLTFEKKQISEKLRKDIENMSSLCHWHRFSPDHKSWKLLEDYLTWAHENNIKVLVAPVPYMEFGEYHLGKEKEFFNHIYSFFNENPFCEVLYHPFDSMYSSTHYYDGRLHLHNEGRIMHSKRIAEVL